MREDIFISMLFRNIDSESEAGCWLYVINSKFCNKK